MVQWRSVVSSGKPPKGAGVTVPSHPGHCTSPCCAKDKTLGPAKRATAGPTGRLPTACGDIHVCNTPSGPPGAAVPSYLPCLDSSPTGMNPWVSCCQQVLVQSRKADMAAEQELHCECWCPLYLRPPELCMMLQALGVLQAPVLPLIPPAPQHSDVPWG